MAVLWIRISYSVNRIATSDDATMYNSIFRELGLSLREEETSGWGGHNWRCRVSAILPGGLIDRFNHMHEHPWVTPGMTIATVYSPMRAVTDVRGMSLAEVTDLFHRCAPGHEVVKEHTNSSGRIKRTTYNGRSITIGFEVTLRALKQRELEPLAHGGHLTLAEIKSGKADGTR